MHYFGIRQQRLGHTYHHEFGVHAPKPAPASMDSSSSNRACAITTRFPSVFGNGKNHFNVSYQLGNNQTLSENHYGFNHFSTKTDFVVKKLNIPYLPPF